MASSAPRPCGHPGCGVLVSDGNRCAKHAEQAKREQDQRRGSSAQRGYGYRWQKASKTYLSQHPLCVYCQRNGFIVASKVVDHIIPHRNNQTLFWDSSNWQALCLNCHNSRKQSEEKSAQHLLPR